MAGLGRKEFNSGDILLASEVQGYLQDQAVMVFDDAAARGSAIPNPSEGMLTYNKDTDALELYDGSAFGPVGSDAGLIHIETVTFSAVASQSFNDVFSATYDNYVITCTLSVAQELYFRLRVGGSDASGNYNHAMGESNNSGYTNRYSTSQSFGFFGTQVYINNVNGLKMEVIEPFLTVPTKFLINTTNLSGGIPRSNFGGGIHNVSTSYTGISLIPSSGTISGTASIYGLKKV